MPITCNNLLQTKTVRIENQDGSKGVYLYYDSFDEVFKTSSVNHDPYAIPNYEAFTFNQSTLNQSDYFTVNESMLVHVYFDANIGSNTGISSQNGIISKGPPIDNWFNFSYLCTTISDIISIIVWNQNNTKYKVINLPITLKTTQGVPLSFSQNPTTQNFTYSNLVVNFNKAIKSIGSITSFQNPNQTITFTTNNSSSITLTNYMTPTTNNDVLTFNNVIDTSDISNVAPVDLNVNNLFLGPRFFGLENMINSASQNHAYTDIIAKFSKDIVQNPDISKPISVLADVGPQPTNIRIEAGKIKFDWTTASNTTVKISFHNLYSSDGFYDDGTIESTTFTLFEPVTNVYWFLNQPVLPNTQYTDVEVTFGKAIRSCVAGGSGFVSLVPKGVNSAGNFVFDVLTGPNQPTFNFYDIIGLDYSHQNGPLSLSVGASIESVVNSSGNISNQVLIKPESQTISFTFNKAISNQPTLGINGGASYQFSSKSNSDKTLHYNFTDISINSNLIIFGTVISNDSSYSSGLNVPLSPIPALEFSLISDVSQPDTNKSSYDVGTLYNLYAKFNSPPNLNADFSGVSISCPNATVSTITSVDGNNKYKFDLTPNNSGTNQISISNAKDVNNFVYSLFTSGNLTFNAVLIYYKRFLSSSSNNNSGTIAWSSEDGLLSFGGFAGSDTYTGYDYNGIRAIKLGATNPFVTPVLTPENTVIYIFDARQLNKPAFDEVIFHLEKVDGNVDNTDRAYFYDTSNGSVLDFAYYNATLSSGATNIPYSQLLSNWTSLIITKTASLIYLYVNGNLQAILNRTKRDGSTKEHNLRLSGWSSTARAENLKVLEVSFLNQYIDAGSVATVHSNAISRYGTR